MPLRTRVFGWFHKRRWWALAGVSAATGALGYLAGRGVPPKDVQFAPTSEAFTALFHGHLLEKTRTALSWDYRFIPVYVLSIALWAYLTGRKRALGRRPWVDLAAIAAVVAGVLDVLENRATATALNAVRDQGTPNVGPINHYATAKWIVLGSIAVYFWGRALQTPRRLAVSIPDGHQFSLLDGPVKVPARAKRIPMGRPRRVAAKKATAKAVARRRLVGDEPNIAEQPSPTLRRQVVEALLRRRVLRTTEPAAPNRFERWLLRSSPYRGAQSIWHRLFGDPVPLPDVSTLGLDGRLPAPPPGTIGIACSGGGVRSACFTLGALQELRQRGTLENSSTVTAVSGGGYLAAGWAIAASRRPDVAEEVFAPNSPEERWLRRHSALIPDIPVGLGAVVRVVAGIFTNVLLIWLVLFMLARPAGWLISVAHPELKARQPYLLVDNQPETKVAIGEAIDVPRVLIIETREGWFVRPELTETKITYWTDVNAERHTATLPVTVDDGFVRVDPDKQKLIITAQPHAHIDLAGDPDLARHLDPHRPEFADEDVPPFTIERDIALRLTDESIPPPGLLARQFRITPPRIAQHSGTTGRAPFAITGEQWAAVGLAFVAFLLVQLGQMWFRPVRPAGVRGFQVATWFAGIAAATTFVLLALLPWLVYVVPPFVAHLVSGLPGPNTSAAESSQATAAVAATGTGVVAIGSIFRLLKGPATALARKWPLLVAKVVVFLILVVTAFVVFVGQVQLGAANGPGGHLVAAGTFGVGILTRLRDTNDITRWIAAGLILLGWRYWVDAHANSLFPFYKHRMSEAFAVERMDPDHAEPVPYEKELAWTDVASLHVKGHGKFRLNADEGPELVLCATANAYGRGEAASGRKATSFTFSARRIGGPGVGYVPTDAYLDALSDGRRKDVTVPSAIAIAGAAFSPGMGKMSKGPIDNLLAVANARLGVWLPNPIYVKQAILHNAGAKWRDRPGWPQFLREVLGLFRLWTPYIYISDGGHWENLGMVELLRRGCRNVFIISAAGDGATSFSTIGEAIALAREELQLEIDIDLEPMRAAWFKQPPEVAIPAGLRMGDKGDPAAISAQGFAKGRIYERQPNGDLVEVGLIVVMEANFFDKSDWDVVTYKEGHAIFPDDSTLNQNFDHRQLESYRMLGRRQVEDAFTDAEVRDRFGF